MSEQSAVRLVLSTCPADHAQSLADALVGEGLAACVNIVPGLRSVYRWKGELCCDAESILLLKTTAERYPQLQARLAELHPYEVPEIIALPVEAGLEGYLGWVREAVSGSRPVAAKGEAET